MARNYSKKASEKVEKVVRKQKKVKSRKQAVAIGFSEARKKGAKVPNGSSKRKFSKKKE